MKLKYKLAMAVFISGVLIIGLASIIYYIHFFKIATRRHLQEFQYDTAIIASHVNGLLIEKAGKAAALTHTPLLRDALSASNTEFQALDPETRKDKIAQLNQRWMALDDPLDPFIQAYLANPVARYLKRIQDAAPNGEYGELFLTDRYGALVAATAKLTTLAHGHKYWWRGACEQGRIFLDDRGYDDSVGEYVLGIVVPVYQEGELAGVLKCNLKILGGVSDILIKASGHIPDTLQIVRSGGRVVYEKNNPSLQGVVSAPLRQKLLLHAQGAFLMESDAPDRFVGFTPVALTANRIDGYRFGGSPGSIDHREGNRNEIWYVVKSRPTVIVQQLLRKTVGLLFAIGCGLSVLFAGIAIWVGYRLTRPIEALIDATRDIGKGRFDRRIHPPSRDEVGRLAHAFNRMAEELSRISASRAELEQEVERRIDAEKAMQAKQERLDGFLERAPIGIFQSTPEGRYLQINERFAKMLAFEPDELSRIPNIAALYIDPAQRDEVRRLLSEHGKIEDFHIHARRKDGRDMWMAIFVEARKNARNGIDYYDGFTIDITERKRSDFILERMRYSINKIPDSILWVNEEGTFFDVNDSACRNLGYTRDELLTMCVADIDPYFPREIWPRHWKQMEQKGSMIIESVHQSKTGERFPVEVAVHHQKFAGFPYNFVLVRDITKRRQDENALRESEERYRTIFNNSLVCMAMRQGDRLLMANKAFCDMIDRTEEELLRSTPEDFVAMIHPDDAQLIYQRHLDRIANKDVPSRYEYRYIKKDGRIVWVDALVQTLLVAGRPSQLGMYVDITDRKQAEQGLRDALDEKVILLREIHHRVKNNMQVIISLLRMHARKNQDLRLKMIFDDCRGRVEAMSLIHEALYQSDEMARVDFGDYLLKLCRNLGHVHGAEGKGITVNADRGDVGLTMDQGIAVGMVIAELVSNAFKHAFPSEGVGDVAVGMTVRDAETVELTIADDGQGLPADFDISFSRSLGMRLVWGAVTRELGGTLAVERDKGTTFIIRFPFKDS